MTGCFPESGTGAEARDTGLADFCDMAFLLSGASYLPGSYGQLVRLGDHRGRDRKGGSASK